jgi:hypothetical protein
MSDSPAGVSGIPDTAAQSDSGASIAGIPEGRFIRLGGHTIQLGSAGVAQDSSGGLESGEMLAMFMSTQEGLYTIDFIRSTTDRLLLHGRNRIMGRARAHRTPS